MDSQGVATLQIGSVCNVYQAANRGLEGLKENGLAVQPRPYMEDDVRP